MDTLNEKIEKFFEGYGYGNGSGNGYGNGYGYGSGIVEFDGHKVYIIDDVPTCITQVKGDLAKGFTIKYNAVKVTCFVARCDGFFAHGETAHDAMRDAREKAMEAKPLSDKIADILKAHPDPDAEVYCSELFSLHHILTGSCEFGRRQFCERHGIDVENDKMTLRKFCELTRNEYGGEAVKALAEKYGIR